MNKNLSEKVKNSIKDRTFFIKFFARIKSEHQKHKKIFYVSDLRVKDEIRAQKVYDKLFKKYENIIKEGVSENLQHNKSNIVWICWLQGIENAPELVKACVESVKMNMPNKDIVILTEDTISDYIEFPEFILNKREKGIIPAAHFSDLLRTELITKYGGIWLDATVLCTASAQDFNIIEKSPFFMYKKMELNRKSLNPFAASSWLISSESNNEILLLTKKLLYSYWEKNNYLQDYYLFHLFFSMATKRYPEIWNNVPCFNNCSPHTMMFELDCAYTEERWIQYVNMSSFHKLNRYINVDNPSSNYAMVIKKYYS